MTSTRITESTATFEQQAKDAGLGQPWIDDFKNANMNTLAKLCYAVTVPGTTPTDAQIATLFGDIRPGVVPTLADTTAMKRLIFESQTLMVYALKASVQGSDETVYKLAPAERRMRLEDQRTRLSGISISGPLEPAHSLYDLCASMIESNEIKYISPSKCLTRHQELQGQKPDKEIQLDATKSNLVVKEQPVAREINITSDLMLCQAMQRRALALDLVGLASFGTVMKWTDRMFELLARQPAPGFHQVSQAQLLRADRHSFLRMNELLTGTLKPQGAVKPMDALFTGLHTDVTVTYFMLPTMSGSSTDKAASDKTTDKPGNTGASNDKKRPGNNNAAQAKQGQPAKRNKGKGGGKARDPVPQALKGMHSRTPEGKAICFSYNLGKCDKGAACVRERVCCVPQCYGPHPQSEHK